MAELELEKEFEKFKEIHKYAIIYLGLIMLEDDGAYDESPFRERESRADRKDTGVHRAKRMAVKLFYEYKDGNVSNFEKAYEYCWSRIAPQIDENFNASIDYIKDETC